MLYSAIIYGCLLVTGFTNNLSFVKAGVNNSLHFTLSHQQIVTLVAQENECPSNEKGPLPGCGRRDT